MIGKRSLYGLTALVASSLAVQAHGPTRQKVNESIEINAPPAKVWAMIGNFQDMKWHPVVAKSEGTGGNDIDASRKLTLVNGGTIDEQLYKYNAAEMTYSYRITTVDVKVLPVTNYSSTITVTPVAGEKSVVEWRGAFYRGYPNNDPPPELNDDAAIAAVTAVYRTGLDALKKSLEGGS